MLIGRLRNESFRALAESVSTICQAVLINEKSANVSIDGIINLAFKEFYNERASGQDAIINLLENNLYYAENGTKMNEEMNLKLTGYFAISNYGTAKINDLAINNFQLPMISCGDMARINADNQFSGSLPAENSSFAQILNTSEFNAFNVVLNILKYFNWTLVACLYQSNSYGYTRQELVLNYAGKNSSPKFACNTIFGIEGALKPDNVDLFCNCITQKSTINVLILWMSTEVASLAIHLLKRRCSAAKKWTFIITDDYQSPENYGANANIFKNSLLIRKNGPWDFKSFLQKCQEKAPEAVKQTIRGLLENYYNLAYNCTTEQKSEDFSTCTSNFYSRTEKCICTLDETEQDPYTVNNRERERET